MTFEIINDLKLQTILYCSLKYLLKTTFNIFQIDLLQLTLIYKNRDMYIIYFIFNYRIFDSMIFLNFHS